MKTLSHQTPAFFPHGPEAQPRALDPYLVKFLLQVALVAALFAGGLGYIATMPNRIDSASATQTTLELSLSGAYTSNLSLDQSDLNVTRTGPSGFTVSSKDGAVVPFTLNFRGAASDASQTSSFFLTGARDDLGLTLSGTTYTLLSGNVTVTPNSRTVYATFSNAQGQPLELSARLSF